jgi:mutator protein MutT
MKRSAGILLIKDRKVLLIRALDGSKQLNGTISFPGGDVEDGETLEQTAKREFQEETGFTPGELIDFPRNYVEAVLKIKSGIKKISFKVYITQDYTGNLKSSVETEPFWTDLEKAQKMKLFGKNNQILDAAIKYLGINI